LDSAQFRFSGCAPQLELSAASARQMVIVGCAQARQQCRVHAIQTRVAFQQRHQQLMPEPHSRMPRQHLPGI